MALVAGEGWRWWVVVAAVVVVVAAAVGVDL